MPLSANGARRAPSRSSVRHPLRHHRLAVAISLPLLGLACGIAHAGNSGNGTLAAGTDGNAHIRALDSVVVLGSRSGVQTELDSSAPIQVIGAEDLQRSGAPNLSAVLQQLVPSFNFPTSAPNANAASFVKGVALRGLASDQTLVLVNGKRRHATAQLNASSGATKGAQPVDLNTIPLNMVARVEVLLDGAAAQYGSDAVAGVVNIVLKEVTEGGQLRVFSAANDQGDGQTHAVEGNVGFALPGSGFLTVGFDAWDAARTQLSTTDTRRMYFAGDAREDSYPNRNWFYGNGATQRQNLVLNGETSVGAVTVYATAGYGRRQDEGFGNLRQPSSDQTVRALHPDGFQPWLDVHSRDLSASLGARWENRLGRFDASLGHGSNRVSSVVSNTNNVSLGAASATRFDTGDLANQQTSASLDWSRGYPLAWLVKPLAVAAGLTWRHEAYQVYAGDQGSWINGGGAIADGPNAGKVATPASQGFGGFSPDDAGRLARQVHGGYVEVEAEPSTRLRLTLSGRSEQYDDFGTTSNGRLALRWELHPALAWRASASTGYRAPSLGQQAYSRTIPNITNGVLVTNRVARVDSALARALGASALTPETSRNLSTGLVWTPAQALALTLDLYRISIGDRVALSETLSGPVVRAVLDAAGYPTYSGLQYFTNAADTRTEGVEASARYGFSLADGHRFDVGAGYNWNQTQITALKATPAVLAGSGLVLVGRESAGLIEEANPRSFTRLYANYQRNAVEASVSAARYGTYRTRHTSNPALDQSFAAQTVVNLGGGYRFGNGLTASLGIENLFDSHPDKVIAALRNPVVALYSGLSPAGASGRTYFARVDYAF